MHHDNERQRDRPNPRRPEGFGRNAAVFGVAPPRNGAALTRSVLLESGSVTLRTRTAIPGLPGTNIQPNGAPNNSNDTYDRGHFNPTPSRSQQ